MEYVSLFLDDGGVWYIINNQMVALSMMGSRSRCSKVEVLEDGLFEEHSNSTTRSVEMRCSQVVIFPLFSEHHPGNSSATIQ